MDFNQMIECFPNCGCESSESSPLGLSLAGWSSLAYFLAVIAFHWQLRKRERETELWSFLGLMLSASSLLLHTTYSRWSMAFDYACISMLLLFPLLRRWTLSWKIFLGIQLLLFVVFFSLPKWWRIGLAFSFFLLALLEVSQGFGAKFNHKFFRLAVRILLASFLAFLLEELKLWCDNRHWIQGHTVWHAGSALSLYFYGLWRFQRERSEEFPHS
jgi:hypothetical protein